MKLTDLQVTNAIFETLRKLLVTAGYLPDYTTFTGTATQIETAFENGRDIELIRRDEAFVRQLEQDEWMLTLAENLEDFQRPAAAVPDVSG